MLEILKDPETLRRQAEKLRLLRQSPGFDALVDLLKDCQVGVILGMLGEREPQKLLNLAIEANVFSSILVWMDTTIETADKLIRQEVDTLEASRRVAGEMRLRRQRGVL